MLKFIKDNSFEMVKLFISQIAMTVFGTMLTLATSQNPTLLLCASIFSILFYMVLIYTQVWELGAKDKIRVDSGRMAYRPAKGFWLGFGANVPNLLLALLMGLGVLVGGTLGMEWGGNMSVVCNAVARLVEGMYLGVITTLEKLLYGGASIEKVWWWFIIITLPAMLVSWFGYTMGLKNIRIGSIFGISPNLDGKGMQHKD